MARVSNKVKGEKEVNRYCRCGGRISRTDLKPINYQGRTVLQDTDKLVANFACNKCKTVYTQKKRQSLKQLKEIV